MCLAIPMQVLEIDGLSARCEAKGIERMVSLFLLQHETVLPGDMLVIHVGYAIQKISVDAARSAWELYDEMLAAADALGAPARGETGATAGLAVVTGGGSGPMAPGHQNGSNSPLDGPGDNPAPAGPRHADGLA